MNERKILVMLIFVCIFIGSSAGVVTTDSESDDYNDISLVLDKGQRTTPGGRKATSNEDKNAGINSLQNFNDKDVYDFMNILGPCDDYDECQQQKGIKSTTTPSSIWRMFHLSQVFIPAPSHNNIKTGKINKKKVHARKSLLNHIKDMKRKRKQSVKMRNVGNLQPRQH